MARKKTQADKLYNMRRRLMRQAERELKLASKSTGAAASRHEYVAEKALQRAIDSYTGKVTKKAEKLMAKLGKPLEKSGRKQDFEQLERFAERGKFRFGRKARQEQQATEIFNSSIGSRIVGAFESVWRDKEGNPIELIQEYLGVSSPYEVIEKVEAVTGDALYQEPRNDIRYDEVTGMIRAHYNL